jgi:hypothetical protein
LDTKNKINLDLDKYSTLLICMILGGASIKKGLLAFIRTFVNTPLKLDVVLFYVIFLIIVLKSLSFLKAIFKKDVMFLLLLLYFYFAVSFLKPSAPEFLGEVLGDFTLSIICYVLARSISNLELLYDRMRYLSFPIAISVILQLIFFKSNSYLEGSQLEGTYDQYLGYLTLTSATLSLSFLMKRVSIINLITFLISFTLIVIIGARGPLVSLIIFYFFKLFHNNIYKPKGIMIILISFSVIFIGYFYYINEFIGFADFFIKKYGFSSRLVDFANSDTFLEDENRNRLLEYSIELIKLNPIFGLGIAQERIPLNSLFKQNPVDAIGNYPHNIFIELFLHFGVIMGSILILLVFRLLFLSLTKNDNFYSKEVIMIFLGIGFFPLFFSGSYLGAPLFFLLLGFCYNTYSKINYKRPVS